MRMRSSRLGLCLLFAAFLGASPALADQTVPIEGDVPSGGPDHFYLPFTVPAGVREIEIRHDDLSTANILDWGLDDPAGYRGWGGGTSEPAVVGELAASRAYVPGSLTPGTWRVVVGKALVVQSPARYRVEVVLRDAPTLLPQPERTPYVPVPALLRGRRYYAGDLHVHSRESTDARPALAEITAFAATRGLDFVEISDHNTVTQLAFFTAAQAQSPRVLLVPGIEVTTYAGHLNAIGATRFIEHKIGLFGITIADTAKAARSQGALLSINHPTLDLGDACLGCAFKQPLAPTEIAGIELGTGGQQQGALLFTPGALSLWESLLAQGHHVAALGGSDDHQGGKGTGRRDSPLGDPTTLVFAEELSVAALLDGIRRGRTVVKLQGPGDPMAELSSPTTSPTLGGALPGDTLRLRSGRLVARITGGLGHSARFVKDGEAQEIVPIDADPFELTQDVRPEPGEPEREIRWRVEVLVDKVPRTLTSPIYVRYDPEGPDALAAPEPAGCRLVPSAARTRSGLPCLGLGLLWALAALLTRRRRGRSCRRAWPG